MRLYAVLHLVAVIALAKSARTRFSLYSKRDMQGHGLAIHQAGTLTVFEDWDTKLRGFCGCKWRKTLNYERAQNQKLKLLDVVFYLCIMFSACSSFVFFIFWTEKEGDYAEIQYSDDYHERIRAILQRHVEDDDVVRFKLDGGSFRAFQDMPFRQFKEFGGEELRKRFPIQIKVIKEKEMPVSIFQCIGILKELQRHRKDLRDQLKTIARSNQEVLSNTLGEHNLAASRIERLKNLLCSALKKENLRHSDGAKALLFFLELEDEHEFLHIRWSSGKRKLVCFYFAVIVVVCQTAFVAYLCWDGMKDYYCSTLGWTPIFELDSALDWKKNAGSIVRGITKLTLVSIVFLCIWGSHAQKVAYYSELRKQPRYRFPVNKWTMVGDVVTGWSTFVTAVAANTVVWVPQILLNVIGYCLVVLALYNLNEIIVGVVFRKPDVFQQWGVELNKLLEACPLSLEDLVNINATQDINLFVIETINSGEKAGKLKAFDGNPCETRIRVEDTRVYYQAHRGRIETKTAKKDLSWIFLHPCTTWALMVCFLPSVAAILHAFNHALS